MTHLDDSSRRATRGPDERERQGSTDDALVRGLLAREHCRVGAPLEVVSADADSRRLYREVPVRVDREPATLLVGPWRVPDAGTRGRIASVSGEEFGGRLLTVAVEFERENSFDWST